MKFTLIALLIISSLFTSAQENLLFVGTYTGGKSEGIYVYSFNSADGSSKEISHAIASNPSFITVSPDEKYIYAVFENGNKGNGGEVAAFSFDKTTGKLSLLNRQPSGGDHPCYITTDKTGKWIVAGNYSSGSLSVFPVNNDGTLGTAVTHLQHEGKSVNQQRQEKAHVHCTVFSADNKYLFVPDLGIDKVMIYTFNEKTGMLTSAPQPFFKTIDGDGPRHLTFHPNKKFAYLVEELSGTVITFRYKKGRLVQLQRSSTMPDGDKSFPGSADIHVSPDGRFLYASNRANANSIAIFSIDPKTGMLKKTGYQSTMGKTPRNFNFDPTGNFLLVANQDSDEIVVFRRDITTGQLTDTGKRMSVGKPVCLKWID